MTKFACRCGHIISLQTGDDPEEHKLLNQIAVNKQCDKMDDDNISIDADGLHDFIEYQGLDVLICPKCTRIYIDLDDDNRYTAYVNEDNPPAD